MSQTVYTFVMVSDGEVSTGVFLTQEARDNAVLTEALERREAAKKVGEDVPEIAEVVADPAHAISDMAYGEVDVSTDAVPLED